MRMKGRQTISECCTQCMLYSVYAVLGVNSWSCHGEMERDDLTLCSAMMVEMWMRKRVMWDEDENDVEDTSGYEKSGVRLAWLGWDDLVSVLLHAGSGLIPAVSGMVNWLAHEILLSRSFSWRFVPSPLPSPKNTKLSHPSLSLHAMIKSQPCSRSAGWGWEDMILPGREDPPNCVDSRNRRKREWDRKMGKMECVVRIDRQSGKKRQNSNRRVICNATSGIDAGCGMIRHRVFSDCSDGARPLWRSHSSRTEMFFADLALCVYPLYAWHLVDGCSRRYGYTHKQMHAGSFSCCFRSYRRFQMCILGHIVSGCIRSIAVDWLVSALLLCASEWCVGWCVCVQLCIQVYDSQNLMIVRDKEEMIRWKGSLVMFV